MIRLVLGVVIVLFPLSELALAVVKRSRGGGAKDQDRGSMALLWFFISIGVTLAFCAVAVREARIPVARSILVAISLVLMVGGLALRWAAIVTLGEFFTVNVTVRSDQRVVDSGLYHYMRHPSYTGLMIAFLGFGVFFGNWLSLIGMLLPITLGIINRVAKEERALLASLGPAYASYCVRTKRFIPGVF
jgi:protein-S-isoprenylcysteine O-methyltransferase